MKLKANPYQIFETQQDPISLHVRRNFLNENGQIQTTIEHTIRRIVGNISSDGSWDHSTPLTIENIFALWLLVEEAFGPVHTAMDWLLELSNPPPLLPSAEFVDIFGRYSGSDKPDSRLMHNVPFTPGCFVYTKTGAALFFSMKFDRQNDKAVLKAYRYVDQKAVNGNGRHCSGSCGHNLRLAMAVHPQYRQSEGMHLVLNYLSDQQKETGTWSAGIPFYPTVYLLSYLDVPLANKLFEKALIRVKRSQLKDGSWGKTQKQLDTFLVLDSLRRKGIEWTS